MGNPTFALPKLLYAMTSHVSRDSDRIHTPNVLFAHRHNADRDRSALVATDGRRLAFLEWGETSTESGSFRVLIPTASIKALRAPKPADEIYYVTVADIGHDDPTAVRLMRGAASIECDPPDSRHFPSFDDVIPDYQGRMLPPKTPFFALNPQYVADAMKLHADFARLWGDGSERHFGVFFWNDGCNRPIVLESYNSDANLKVVIMPLAVWDRETLEAMASECERNQRRRHQDQTETAAV